MRKYNKNDSQIKSIINIASKSSGISLLQGPPGTGKTSTLLKYFAIEYHRRPSNKKMLICAPSNAAVDNIATKIIDDGILGIDGYNKISFPEVLRMGKVDPDDKDLIEINFDYRCEKRLFKLLSMPNTKTTCELLFKLDQQ
eukprot:GHVR01151302.1.p1 GENE.GHVR01151302.1~~GHVR01151302.1.p1  ORF type:complete len:141 (+),score=6.14 GHVR01151302.1:873-1295(+)